MKWTDLLRGEIEYNYAVADKLMGLVDDSALDWKPATGSNWMTTGQLLMHMTDACGSTFKGFITGDWGMPEGVDPSEMGEDMMPSAEKMPAVKSVAEAKKLLAEDKVLSLKLLDETGEDRLENEDCPAPWNPAPVKLGLQLLGMVGHLTSHKGQLFYYLKLQGKDVNTMNLWGA